MRVLLVSTSDAGGGAQEIGMRLLDELRARGHRASVAVGARHTDDPDVHRIPNDDERPWPARRLAGRRTQLAAQPRRLARVLRGEEDFEFPGTRRLLELPAEPPELVHAHNLHGGYFDLRALPALSHRVPVVATLHDAWLMTGHCAHSLELERWRTGCGDCPHLEVYPAVRRDATAHNWRRKRAIYERARLHLVTPCAWLRERVDASMLAAAAVTTQVIPNGIDLRTFSPGDRRTARAGLGLPVDADVLVFAGASTRSDPFKDVGTLEAALARIGERPRSRPLLLLSVGEEGPTQRVGSAELRMIGHVGAPASLVPYYRAADVYVHAARADTFPTTVLEALACGTPVVASRVGGIPEQVDEGVTGRLVAPGDPAALEKALDAALGDAAWREAAGRRAREDACRRFGAERMVDDYVSLYRRLIERGVRDVSSADSSPMRSA